jgi:hypothetical protein
MAKKSPMARVGKSNGRWKGGRSKSYRRRVTKAKPGQIVHHRDGNKGNNKKSNFKIIKGKKGLSPTGAHNKLHPDRSKGSGAVKFKIKSKSK